MKSRGSIHRRHGRPRSQCREHDLTQEHFLPQLRRLLVPGRNEERLIYDSLVADIVGVENPLDLFERRQLRAAIYLIEALYRAHVEHAARGDERCASSLAALCYSRWVAWRRFEEALHSGVIRYGRGVRHQVRQSREDVMDHLRHGWKPAANHRDDELIELISEA